MSKHRQVGGSTDGRVILVSPERIAYRGLLGRPDTRVYGALTLYVAQSGSVRVECEGEATQEGQLAVALPFHAHRICATDREIGVIMLEAEATEAQAARQQFAGTAARRKYTAARVRQQLERLVRDKRVGDFDQAFLGAPAPPAQLDPRIAGAVRMLRGDDGGRLGAGECARHVGLSLSRFTHLFRDEVGTTVRRFRAWKRARQLMTAFGQEDSLTGIALTAGYTDAAHFCNAIRRFYGLTPSMIVAGTRRVTLLRQNAE